MHYACRLFVHGYELYERTSEQKKKNKKLTVQHWRWQSSNI